MAAEPSALEKLKEKAKGGVAPQADPNAQKAAMEAYKPSLKFKAAGKEHDVPKLLAEVMKDPEAEKYVHGLLSKAYGLEMVQSKLKETREDRQNIAVAYQKVMAPISEAREAYARKDLDTVFEKLRIEPNLVLQWAYDRAKLSQMPPEQRQLHEARIAAERRAYNLEREQRTGADAQMEAQAQHVSQMLDMLLEQPTYSAIAQEYDSREGKKEGSFRDLVAQCGESEWFRTGKLIPVTEAAKMALDLLGMKPGAPAAKAEPAPASAAPAQQPTAQVEVKPKITLPNAGGSKSASPAKPKITSIDGLKKKYDEMRSSG